MSTEILTVAQDHMTLDVLLWRRFHTEAALRVETSMRANQDLAELGPILPVGTKVEIEVAAAAVASGPVRVLRLWG